MDLRQQIIYLMPELTAYARTLAGDPSDAEDLVGSAIERALKAGRIPADTDELRPWMFRVIRNLQIDEVRKARTRMEYSGDVRRYLEEARTQPAPTDRLSIRQAFAKLPAQAQEILFLVDIMGMKYAEVSEVIDIPLGTVMSRVSRARRSLMELLAEGKVVELPKRSQVDEE